MSDKELIGYYICKTKLQYRTRKKAWKSALYFFIHLGTLQRAYKCGHCNKYHLSSKHTYYEHLPLEFKQGFNEWYGQPIYETTETTPGLDGVPEVPKAVQLYPLSHYLKQSSSQLVPNLRGSGGKGVKV